jgi:transcription initiation factor TFIID subunit TAF12
MTVDDMLSRLGYHVLLNMMKGMIDCESTIENENQELLLQEANVQAEEDNDQEGLDHDM